MNRASLKTFAANFVGDPSQTRFADHYDDALNKANEQFALDSRCTWKDQSYSWTADDTANDLPADFMWEDYITWDDKPLIPISRYELAKTHGSDWTDNTGTPTHVIIDPEEASKSLRVYPTPSSAGTVKMRYFAVPAAMASDSASPLNGQALLVQFHLAISAYAAWLLLIYEELTPAIQAKRGELLKMYNDAVSQAVDRFKNSASAPIQMRGSRAIG